MSRLRCGPLAAWASAWLAGRVAFDDVLSAASAGAAAPALTRAAPTVGSAGGRLPVGDSRIALLGEILITWRQARATVRLVLPVPGDTRGVPGPAAFRTAALDTGQAVIGVAATALDTATAAVPELIDHRPSSAPATLIWHEFEVERPAPDYVSVADAQFELTEAIRDCASALARLTQQGRRALEPDDLNDELAAARRVGERINLPPGFPPPAVALIAQAERMSAVLDLSGAARPTESDDRLVALAPLVTAVRRARLAGYNATA